MIRIIYLVVFTVLVSAGCNGVNGDLEFRHHDTENKLDIFINDNFFTSFFYPDTAKKPVLYPIHNSSGIVITRGYPHDPRPFEIVDHPHHVGLWLNFGDVNGLDFWNNSFRVDPEREHRYGTIKFREFISENPRKNELVVGSEWVDANNNVLLDEETTFVFEEINGLRSIERTSKLIAIQDVTFKGNKEGLLGLRMDRAFQEPSNRARRILDATGKKLTDEPIVNNEGKNGVYSNANGDVGGDVWGERSPWVALRAEKDGEVITVTIFDHKTNPYYPAWSHARGYGLFAVNNLGGRGMHDDAEEVEINLSPGESISFTHLIVIGGDMSDEELESIHNDFN